MVQCEAETLKGNRCGRRAAINGYCLHHHDILSRGIKEGWCTWVE